MRSLTYASILAFFALILSAFIPATGFAAASLDTVSSPGAGQLTINGQDLNLVRYIRVSTNATTLKYFRPGCGCGTNPGGMSVIWSNTAIQITDPDLTGRLIKSFSALANVSASSSTTVSVSKDVPDFWVNPELQSVTQSATKQVTFAGEGLGNVPFVVLETALGERIYYNPTGAPPNRAGVTINAWNDGQIVITDLGLAPGTAIVNAQTLWTEPGPNEVVGASFPLQIYIPGTLTSAAKTGDHALQVNGTVVNTLDSLRLNFSDTTSLTVASSGWTSSAAVIDNAALVGKTVTSIDGLKFGATKVTLSGLNLNFPAVAVPAFAGKILVRHQGADYRTHVSFLDGLGNATALTPDDGINDGPAVMSANGAKIGVIRYGCSGYCGQAYVIDVATGQTTQLTGLNGYSDVRDVAISPDGSKVAYMATYPVAGIFMVDLATMQETQLTTGVESSNPGQGAVWSPDGTKIVYFEHNGRRTGALQYPNGFDIKTVDVQTHQVTIVADGRANNRSYQWPSWSPDSNYLYFEEQGSYGYNGDYSIPGTNIVRKNVSGGAIQQIYNNNGNYFDGSGVQISPDSSTVAFAVNGAVVLMNGDGTNRRTITTPISGAYGPVFSPSGAQVAFNAYSYDPDTGVSGTALYVASTAVSTPTAPVKVDGTGSNYISAWK